MRAKEGELRQAKPHIKRRGKGRDGMLTESTNHQQATKLLLGKDNEDQLPIHGAIVDVIRCDPSRVRIGRKKWLVV